MKISVNWLKDFIPSFSPDIPSLVEQLTFLGLEVEEVNETRLPDPLVVVGRVGEVRPHPDADRLKVCRVDTGDAEPLQVVCGAPNVAGGQLVPVARIGARLETPDGETFTIRKSKIRGEASFGMICAADELGLSDDHSGIMVLDESCRVGEPLANFLPADTVLDIAVTPNRPDALSHLGVAREIAGVAGVVLPEAARVGFSRDGGLVSIEDVESCPYYTAVVLRGVRVGESPAWLKERLESIGLRPKNTVVDVTNYILHALGQPLHAFDLAKLEGGRVRVRSDVSGSLQAINLESCDLKPGMPVICDALKPAAVAGVMGGDESAVSDTTTDILLESAYFSPAAVRKTSKALGLTSDSSYRFERGVDPGNVRFASECAVRLIRELSGGEIAAAEEAGSVPEAPPEVGLRPARANGILGTAVPAGKMTAMLERIGFKVRSETEERIVFSVPTFRVDVSREIDLVEEVARLEGYDNIRPAERMVASYPQSRSMPEFFPDYLRTVMIGLRFREILTNPLITGKEASLFGEATVPVLNPISEGLEVLRPGLLPSALKVVAHNIRHGSRDLRFFEVARGFTDSGGLEEKEYLTVVLTGSRFPVGWSGKQEPVDFFDMKGAVEMLLEKLNLLDKSSLNIYNDKTLSIVFERKEGGTTLNLHAGTIQQIEPEVLDAFDIDQQVFAAEIDVNVLGRCFAPNAIYEPPSKYPVVERDLSFIVPEGLAVRELTDAVRKSDALIRDVRVFDLFERETDAPGGGVERSVAVSLDIADSSGTLKEEKIKKILLKVIANAESKHGAVIRQV